MNILSIYLIIGMIVGIGDSVYGLIAYPEENSHKWWMLIRHALILTIMWPILIIILINELLFVYPKMKKQFKKDEEELKIIIERNKRMVDEYWNLK